MLAINSEPAEGLHGDGEAWQDLTVAGPQNGGFATNLIFLWTTEEVKLQTILS